MLNKINLFMSPFLTKIRIVLWMKRLKDKFIKVQISKFSYKSMNIKYCFHKFTPADSLRSFFVFIKKPQTKNPGLLYLYLIFPHHCHPHHQRHRRCSLLLPHHHSCHLHQRSFLLIQNHPRIRTLLLPKALLISFCFLLHFHSC